MHYLSDQLPVYIAHVVDLQHQDVALLQIYVVLYILESELPLILLTGIGLAFCSGRTRSGGLGAAMISVARDALHERSG